MSVANQGWYRSVGDHVSNNPNYVVGENSAGTTHNWFLFAIPSPTVGQAYVGATLRLFNPSSGYNSIHPTETYNLTDYNGSFASLVATHADGDTDGIAIYNDLGTGDDYGSVVVSAADNGQFVTITLSAAALADINAAAGKPLAGGGNFALGGFISTLDAVNSNNESMFSGSHVVPFSSNQLILTQGSATAPEPGTLTLGVLALGMSIVMVRPSKMSSRRKA